MRVGVIIATAGRPDMVAICIRNLVAQSKPAEKISVVAPTRDDPGDRASEDAACAFGPRGGALPRNRGLDLLGPGWDIVVFLDGDFTASRHWLANLRQVTNAHPDLKVVTGQVLADGVHGPGLGWADAARLVDAEDSAVEGSRGSGQDPGFDKIEGVSADGCNIAFRVSAMAGLRFDERLTLYRSQHDTNFRCRAQGHGRMTGRQLDHAKIANRIHLPRRGTIASAKAFKLMGRTVKADALKAAWPEPEVGRLGHSRGNLIALGDVIMRRDRPARVGEI